VAVIVVVLATGEMWRLVHRAGRARMRMWRPDRCGGRLRGTRYQLSAPDRCRCLAP